MRRSRRLPPRAELGAGVTKAGSSLARVDAETWASLQQLLGLWETLTRSKLASTWKFRFFSDPNTRRLARVLYEDGEAVLNQAAADVRVDTVCCPDRPQLVPASALPVMDGVCSLCHERVEFHVIQSSVLRLKEWRARVDWLLSTRNQLVDDYFADAPDVSEEFDDDGEPVETEYLTVDALLRSPEPEQYE